MKELFRNCLSVEETDGWFVTSRFTKKQREYYEQIPHLKIRSRAATSVALRFKTSASKLSFDYKIGAKARAWAVVDVILGNKLYSSYTINTEVDEGRVELSLPAIPDAEITVFLPHLVEIEIKDIKSDEPLIPVADGSYRWLALGDSITQGMVARSPFAAYPSKISSLCGWQLLNAGVGGIEFNADELDYIGYEPDLITIALGTNDWGVPSAEEMTDRVSAYLDKLLSLYKCDNIYVITPIWRSDDNKIMGGLTFAEHCAAIVKAAERYPKIKVIDGYALVPHDITLFGDPAGNRQVHPNEEGFEYYSANLMKIIAKDIERG